MNLPNGEEPEMSRAKKTKAAKRRSAIGLYRRVGEVLNHADKIVGKKPKRLGYGDKAQNPKEAKE